LWQTFRSAAIRLSIALVQSIRRLKAHKKHPILTAGFDAEMIEASFKQGVPTVRLPKRPAAQKPEKKIEVNAAA
jgi:HSP20 family molecular chaperone IbpA